MKNTNDDEPVIENSFVLDVNVIFSGVLSRKEIYRKLFKEYRLYTPDFAFIELEKYRKTILKKARDINESDLKSFTLFIFSYVTVVPDYLISEESYHKAESLVKEIDPKDVVYVALAEELGIPLLTRDKTLYEGLESLQYKNIKLFDDFVREFIIPDD